MRLTRLGELPSQPDERCNDNRNAVMVFRPRAKGEHTPTSTDPRKDGPIWSPQMVCASFHLNRGRNRHPHDMIYTNSDLTSDRGGISQRFKLIKDQRNEQRIEVGGMAIDLATINGNSRIEITGVEAPASWVIVDATQLLHTFPEAVLVHPVSGRTVRYGRPRKLDALDIPFAEFNQRLDAAMRDHVERPKPSRRRRRQDPPGRNPRMMLYRADGRPDTTCPAAISALRDASQNYDLVEPSIIPLISDGKLAFIFEETTFTTDVSEASGNWKRAWGQFLGQVARRA